MTREPSAPSTTLDPLAGASEADLRARLAAALEQSRSTIISHDTDLRVRSVTGLLAPLGERFVGRRPGEALPADAARLLEEGLREALRHDAPVRRDVVIPWEGGPRAFEATFVADHDAAGAVDGVTAVLTDVTDLREASLSRTTLDRMLEGAWVIDRDLRCLYVNAAGARQARRERAGLLGRRLVPSEVEASLPTLARLRACLDAGEPERFSTSFTFPDGSVSWFEISAEPVPEGLFVLSLDVTERMHADAERQLADARVRQLADAMPQLVWSADDDGRTDYVNARVVDYPDIVRLADGTWAWEAALHPDDVDPDIRTWNTVMADHRPYSFEHRMRVASGAYRWHVSRGTAVEQADGTFRWYGSSMDIHDLRMAQEAAEREGERSRLASAVASIGVFEHDHRFAEHYWSPEMRAIYGVPPDMVITDPVVRDLTHADDREILADGLRHAFDATGDGLLALTFRIVRPDGAMRWVSSYSRTLFKPDGSVDRTVGVVTDVTEREEAVRAVRESETRLRNAFAALRDAIVVLRAQRDASGRIVDETIEYANPAWRRIILGSEKEDPTGRPLVATYPAFTDRLPFHVEVIETGRPHRWVRQVPGGDEWYDSEYVKFGDGIIAVSRDVTDEQTALAALRTGEERFRTTIETLLDPLVILRAVRDGTGRIVDFIYDYANAAAGAANRVTPHDLVGRRLMEFLPAHESAGLLTAYSRVIETGEPLVLDGFAYADAWGGERLERIFDVRASRLGESLVYTWRDVTDRRRLAERLARTDRLAAVGRLATAAAHDFGNVLLGIRIFQSYLAASLPPDDPRSADLHQIALAVERGQSITDQLLEFGRGRPDQPPEAVDVSAVVGGLLPMIERVAGRSVEVVVDAAPGARARVRNSGFEQALLNLVFNARDAMPEGGRLRISVDEQRIGPEMGLGLDPGTYVRVAVSDTGTGMAPEVIEHALEPFFTTKASGSGLGLPSAYGTAREAGGTVVIESEPGSGSTITLLLPRAPARDGRGKRGGSTDRGRRSRPVDPGSGGAAG